MLLFSLLTIILRCVNINYPWFESFVRHLVFFATFLGGVLATGRGNHIGIDILGKYLESSHRENQLKLVRRIINLISFCTLIWLISASIDFFKVELKYGKIEFLGIHSGYLVGIIPFGFSLIAYRFFYKFISSFGFKNPRENS